jgi:hypothetical protein
MNLRSRQKSLSASYQSRKEAGKGLVICSITNKGYQPEILKKYNTGSLI